LAHNTTVSFHIGSAEAMAKVRLLEKEKLEPGGATWAQLALSQPVAVVRGDHFIIRSPMETLGGGRVIDLHTRRLRRFRTAVIESLKIKEGGTAEEVIMALLEAKRPLERSALLTQSDLPQDEVRSALDSLLQEKRVVQIGEGEQGLVCTVSGWARLVGEATAILSDYHRRFPARSGMPKVELGSRLKLGKYAPLILQRLIDRGELGETGLAVRLTSHKVSLTPVQQSQVDAFLRSIAQNPYAPPSDKIPESDLLNLLVEQGQVVKISNDVVFATSAYNEMVEKTTAYIKKNGRATLAEMRDLFQTSRKYTQAFLEYLDEKKITRRVGDARVLY
jgi:selenocysteine-specific elongation factor